MAIWVGHDSNWPRCRGICLCLGLKRIFKIQSHSLEFSFNPPSS
jgi:hypothetical protein